MPEVKIQCDCGQRFKFDVEPVHGRMPVRVTCPVCGADGTHQANDRLRELLAADEPPRAAQATPTHALTQVAPPVPPGSADEAGERRASMGGILGVRINRPQPAQSTEGAAAVPRAVPLAAPVPAAATPAAKPRKPSFAMGLLGALIGTLVGSAIYFILFNYTGVRFKLLAVGVGYLAGLGAELLSRKEGSKELGMIAATLTLVGVVSAQYVVARGWWMSEQVTYEASLKDAREIVKAIPNGTDAEIKLYLASQDVEEGEKPDVSTVTDEWVTEFKETELKEARDLVDGKVTKAQFEKKLADEQKADEAEGGVSDEGAFKTVFLLLLLSKMNLVSLAAAAGLAFKVCSNA